jgi:transketolase
MDGIKFERLGIMDKFGKSGKPIDLFREYGLDAATIAERGKKLTR